MDQNVPPYFQEKVYFVDQFLNKRWISAAAATLAGALVLVFHFQSGPKAPEFAKAETLVSRWSEVPEDERLFQEMSLALRKIPSLQTKYEPVIVQKLMEGGKGAEALQMAYRSLERVKDEAPYHAHFAQTSLLIEQGEYQSALERAAALKEKMGRECDISSFWGMHSVGGALLYAHNLLRVACLHQVLNNRPGEKAAWDELSEVLANHSDSPTCQLLIQSFQEKKMNLTHYIESRQLELEK